MTNNLTDNFFNVSIISNYSINNIIFLQYSKCNNIQDGSAKAFCEQVESNRAILNYTNTLYNLTVFAPQFPKLNDIASIGVGSNYNNSDFNLSITCNIGSYKPPKLNIRQELQGGNLFYNDEYNITILCQQANVTIPTCPQTQLTCPEQTVLNKTTCEPVVHDLVIDGINEQIFKIKNQTFDSQFCYSKFEQNVSTCNATISLYSTNMSVCIDNLTNLCTIDEIKGGLWRPCFERFVKNERSSISNLEERINGNDGLVYQLNKVRNENQQLRDNSILLAEVFKYLFWIVAIVSLIFVITSIFINRGGWVMENQRQSKDEIEQEVKNKIIEKLSK